MRTKVCLFAGDTVIYLAIKATDDCIQLRQVLLNLEKWDSYWRLSSILQNVTFYTHHEKVYKLKGQVLDSLHSVKYLRVPIED